jgi:hypothetical protein
VSGEAVARHFDRLAGPEGLTGHASTLTRPDVLVALGAGLAGIERTELEELADRFLAERAVSVVADRTLEERRWSTPELLAVEQRLVASATGRTGEQTAVASHRAVRDAFAEHPTAGPDQQAMVRDTCQGSQGVAVVVGRAGTGKTFALGIARHVWQLDGYRLLAAAPTGIAAISLQGEGFEDVATCDHLLSDLDRGREQLDARTVLVVDEAGMLGSRKLTRLLEHVQQAQAKVVLVGDDRQLASIDAGGGFRAPRLRLGASELTENRRQHQAWEREALELVRSGLVEDAVAAYQAHDRVVAADSKPAATLALLQDWWVAWQQGERDPAQEVIVLAARRTEVDRLKAGTPPTADPTAAPLPTNRADCGDDRISVLIELHLLDHGALDAEQPCPYPLGPSAVSPSAGPASDSRNRSGGVACSYIESTDQSQEPSTRVQPGGRSSRVGCRNHPAVSYWRGDGRRGPGVRGLLRRRVLVAAAGRVPADR